MLSFARVTRVRGQTMRLSRNIPRDVILTRR